MRDSVLITGTGAVAATGSFAGAGLDGSGGACARTNGQTTAAPLTASIAIQLFFIGVFPHERTACSSVRYIHSAIARRHLRSFGIPDYLAHQVFPGS
jgi:hypothetical protein